MKRSARIALSHARSHSEERLAALRRPVKHTVGMTGEVTLQGRVLPIGA